VELLFVLGVGLAAGTIGGIVGFGSSIMLMPVLVIVFGPLHHRRLADGRRLDRQALRAAPAPRPLPPADGRADASLLGGVRSYIPTFLPKRSDYAARGNVGM
jgi:hypothetical protein